MAGLPGVARTRFLSLAALLMLVLVGLALLPTPAAAQTPRVRVLTVDGAITPIMANYVRRGIGDAERSGDAAVVLEMNTPGGLSSAMDDITTAIFASRVPVIVYVTPSGARAASAGVYITEAAQVAAMAPSTNIGSATPVQLDSQGQPQQTDPTMTQKIVNDAVAKIRGFAEVRGRNADWAEQAVRSAVNVTASQALQLHVIDLVEPNLPSLLRDIDGRTVGTAGGQVTLHTAGATTVTDGLDVGERFLQIVGDPSVAYILLSVGMLGLFLELANPGSILPGVLGGICMLLALFSLGSLNVDWAGVMLIGFAFLLFIVDVYVPSHGALTIGGIVSFAVGSFLLHSSTTSPFAQVSGVVIVGTTVALAAFFLFIVGAVIKARLRPPSTGREALVGAVGSVRRALDPEGYVFVEGELWRAWSPLAPIAAGTRVRVIAVEGLRLSVLPAAEQQAVPVARGA